MEQILGTLTANTDYFLLILIRVSSLLMASPIFGRKALPNIVKIAFCLLITYAVFAANPSAASVSYNGVIEFGLMCIKELLFGLVLGYVTTLFFSVVQTAGQLMDMQMGFGMVNVFDVNSNISVPVTGNLLNVIMLVVFFGVNGHLQLIRTLIATFGHIPVGQVALNPVIGLTAIQVFALAFVLAVNVALPLIAAGLLGEVALGFIVRAIPQMNIFVVGIPLKIVLGLMMLFIILPVFVSFSDVLFERMFSSINQMIEGLAP
jgi:flagellar biosynthetic protein FliR